MSSLFTSFPPLLPLPPRPRLFPYTTLFRSPAALLAAVDEVQIGLRHSWGADVAGGCRRHPGSPPNGRRSEEHTSELQSRGHLVCRLLLEKKNRDPARREGPGKLQRGSNRSV